MRTALVGLTLFASTLAATTATLGQAPNPKNNIFVTASATVGLSGGAFHVFTPSGDGDTVQGGPHAFIATRELNLSGSYMSGGSNSGTAKAAAHAALGTLGVIVSATGSSDDFLQVDGLGTSFTADELTFFSSHPRITIRTPMRLSGFIEAESTGLGVATAIYRAEITAFTDIGGGQTFSAVKTNAATGPPKTTIFAGNFPLVWDVLAGHPTLVIQSVQVSTRFLSNNMCNPRIDCTGSGKANASFGNTFSWGGIESVIDSVTGEPVTDWRVISRSGADYTKSFEVPEPATTVPALLAMLAAVVAHRKVLASRIFTSMRHCSDAGSMLPSRSSSLPMR
jgi:hypothetical protein